MLHVEPNAVVFITAYTKNERENLTDAEELSFRGFLQPLLVRTMGAALGITMAAIPFGLVHFAEYGYSWRHALLVTASGAAFGWMRHSTGSTKASTAMHAAYNAAVFAFAVANFAYL